MFLNTCITAKMSSIILLSKCRIDKLVTTLHGSGYGNQDINAKECKCAELATLDDRPELKRNRVLTSLS